MDYDGDEIIMFVNDNPLEITFGTSSGDSLLLDLEDKFICSYINSSHTYTSNGIRTYTTESIRLTPHHVGSTCLAIRDAKSDTIVRVRVMGEYYTYTEPNLDFDDTEDSVQGKLGTQYPSLHSYNIEGGYYSLLDDRHQIHLYVNYSNNGTVDSYSVNLIPETVDAEELYGFIGERYYKTTASWGDFPVYIKALNNNHPSISDAVVVVIPQPGGANRVTYINPLTYRN